MKLTYTVLNLLGQQIQRGLITSQHNSIDLGSAESGMYLLILQDSSGGEKQTMKLIRK
jgi:hypothetical protein